MSAAAATGTVTPRAESALVVSIEEASAWQRTGAHGADLSTPARALSLTGACDPAQQQQTTARNNYHAHPTLKELEPMQPLAPAPMMPPLGVGRDDTAISQGQAALLPEKVEKPAASSGEEKRLLKNVAPAHGRFEQHCPLPPHPVGGGGGGSRPPMHAAALATSSSSARILGSLPRPTPPVRFFSMPVASTKQQRVDTPRPTTAKEAQTGASGSAASVTSASVATPAAAAAAAAAASGPVPVTVSSSVCVVESGQPLVPLPSTTSSVALTSTSSAASMTSIAKHSTATTTTVTSTSGAAASSSTHSHWIPHHNLSLFLHETDVGTNMMLTRLHNGAILLKYGARGSPHYRLVRCDPDFRQVQWSEIKGSHKMRGSVTTDSIRSVERGHCTKIFRERALKSSVANHCFSLVTTARTLDLECCSSNECDMMVLAFSFLVERRDRLSLAHEHDSTAECTCSDSELSRSRSTSSGHGHQPRRRRSISVVSALDVLCDHSKVLSEPNSPTNMLALFGADIGSINDLPDDSLTLPPSFNGTGCTSSSSSASHSHSRSLTPARMQLAVSQVAHSLDLTLKDGVSQETENELCACAAINTEEGHEQKMQSDVAAVAAATVERLPAAPESFPEENTTSESLLVTTPTAAQLQREFSKFAQLNQQLSQQQQPQQQPQQQQQGQQSQSQSHGHGVGASTTALAASSSTTCTATAAQAATGGVYSHTPFVIDPSHFNEQDIFDLSTFAHLAAQSAEDHGRTPFHPDAFTSAAAAASDGSCSGSSGGGGGGFHHRVSSAADDAEFQSHMRRLHEEEVAICVAADPRLGLLQKQLDAYRSDRIKLEQSFAAKIALLETEISE